MDSSLRRSLRPYISSSYQLNFHSDDNVSASAVKIVAQLRCFLCDHGFARASGRIKARLRCAGVYFGLRSLLRSLNKRFIGPKAEQEVQQQRVLLVLLDANFVKPTALRHVFALLALGSNSPPFFLLPGLSDSLSGPLNLPRLSAVTFTSKGTSELVLLLDQIRQHLRPIELIRRATNTTPKGDTSNISFETPKLVKPAGKAKTKRKAMRKK